MFSVQGLGDTDLLRHLALRLSFGSSQASTRGLAACITSPVSHLTTIEALCSALLARDLIAMGLRRTRSRLARLSISTVFLDLSYFGACFTHCQQTLCGLFHAALQIFKHSRVATFSLELLQLLGKKLSFGLEDFFDRQVLRRVTLTIIVWNQLFIFRLHLAFLFRGLGNQGLSRLRLLAKTLERWPAGTRALSPEGARRGSRRAGCSRRPVGRRGAVSVMRL